MDTILINSFSAGLVQTIIGHPFDTIKTLNQIYPNKTDYAIFRNIVKKHGYTYLYRGSLLPLTGGGIQNSFIFTLENYLNKYSNKNYLISGFLAGGISAIPVTPAEYIKCNLQYKNDINLKYFYKKNIYKGFGLTFLRDSIGFSLYFSTYNYLKNINDNPLINGGCAGVVSWIYSYPVDTIKTKYQISNDKIIDIIVKNSNYKIFSGLRVMLIRSFLVNAGIFYTYEYLQT